MKRLFIALNLSVSVVEKLALLQRELESRLTSAFGDRIRLRCPDASHIHLTLKFLGDTPPQMVPLITEAVDEMCQPLFPFEAKCVGIGAFPDPRRPRILWAGLDDESAEVVGLLQKNLEEELAQLGIEKDARPFVPHVTLARIKSRNRPCIDEWIDEYEDVNFGQSYIKDLVLYESHLDRDGARYEVIKRFALGQRASSS